MYKRLKTASASMLVKDDTLASLQKSVEQSQTRDDNALEQFAAIREELAVVTDDHKREVARLEENGLNVRFTGLAERWQLQDKLDAFKSNIEMMNSEKATLQEQMCARGAQGAFCQNRPVQEESAGSRQ